MTTQLQLFGGDAQLPDYLKDWGAEDNVIVREQIPQISFRGKVWRLIVQGKEEVVKNPVDGEPVGAIQVVILDYNKARSRAYYEGDFEEGKNRAPVCWSNDGKVPDANVPDKQSVTCDGCEWSKKGSKIANGKEVTACSQYKRAVVVPATNPDFMPLLLKIPQTSIWDKDNAENEAKNLYAFDQYMDMLKRHGIMHTGKVVTRIKFDHRQAYPKLLFKADCPLPAELKPSILAQIAKKDELTALLNTMPDLSGGGASAAPAPEEFAEPVAAAVTAAPTAPVAPAAPAKATRPRPAKTPQAPAVLAPPPAPPPEPPAALVDEDGLPIGGFGAAVAVAPAVAAPAATRAPVSAATPVSKAPTGSTPGLANLLAGWGGAK